jgi:7-cyano-7-deazaguanine synthase
VQIWNELIQMPCAQGELEVQAPLLELDPWQVVDVGFQVAAPLDRTWSCDEEGSEPCWACRGCRAREAAFQQAAKNDPLRVVRKL